MQPRYLFIAGCERSGTTAIVHLLNADERLIVGRERFKHIRATVEPKHFEPGHFFSPNESETNFRDAAFYKSLETRWNTGNVCYIGDKVPLYYQVLDRIRDRFPACKILFFVRELEAVAASYNARAANAEDTVWPPHRDYREAVKNWNQSLLSLHQFVKEFGSQDVFVIDYEKFYCGNVGYLESLYSFLGLPVSQEIYRKFRSMTSDWAEREATQPNLSDDQRAYLLDQKNEALEVYARTLADKSMNLASKEESEPCEICGSYSFEHGPAGRMTGDGLPPRCSNCKSLERDRITYKVWNSIEPTRRRAWRVLAVDEGGKSFLPREWFSEFERLRMDQSGPEGIIEQLASQPEGRFDAIACNYVLHKVPDDHRLVAELLRLLHDDGFIQLSVPINIQLRETRELPTNETTQTGPRRHYGLDLARRFDLAQSKYFIVSDDATGTMQWIYLLFKRDAESVEQLGEWLAHGLHAAH